MKKVTAQQVAAVIGGRLEGNPERVLSNVASLKDANAESISFLGNRLYLPHLAPSEAGLILIKEELVKELGEGQDHIVCDNVDVAFSKAIMIFAEEPPKLEPGIAPGAVVAETAEIGENVYIGPNAVVEAGAKIGNNTSVGGGCYIGHDARIGDDCILHPNVTVSFRCVLGNRVILQPGVVIGGDGYGFAPTPQGIIKLPQVGIVQIDDDVEVGSNSTIDRARFGKTWIKRGTKIDNLVMIAHNVTVGENCLIIAQVGIAGSAEIGNGVILAAKVGVNGHIKVGDGVQAAATAAIKDNIPPGLTVIGTPAERQKDFIQRYTLPKKFNRLKKKMEALEAKVKQLEKGEN